MSNRYYTTFQEHCQELEKLMEQYRTKKDSQSEADGKNKNVVAKKLRGAVAVELLRQEINTYLESEGEPFKASMMNSYIAGSGYEYDMLVVKKDAKPFMGLVYLPEDVVADVECKAGGLFDLDKDTDNIAKAANTATDVNPEIRFGYITISENVPVNEYNRNGEPTVKHWKETQDLLDDKLKGNSAFYAVTLHQGKNPYGESDDSVLEKFIKFLIGKND